MPIDLFVLVIMKKMKESQGEATFMQKRMSVRVRLSEKGRNVNKGGQVFL